MSQNLFRNSDGSVRNILENVEGIVFNENPLDFFIILARYKFGTRFIKKTHKVIDVGCGHGLGSVFLSKYANEITGVDLDKDLVETNNSNYKKIKNLQFKEFDLLKPSKSFVNKFDVVVSMDVIEHFKKKKLGTVVDSYYNLLNSDGFAIIGTPNIASRPYASQRRLDTHEFEFTRDEFEKTLLKKFKNVFIFSMTDEVVSTSFPNMAWFFIAICTK
jgi:2-polyprenyl-3-methyl-5-hydroxy-6-metoxy-1,4-benzoquinol methylase